MPVDETKVLAISCDNSACPGNDLDATDRTGWTFVNTEVYGEPTQQHVYCCAMCAGTVGDTLADDEDARASAKGAEGETA